MLGTRKAFCGGRRETRRTDRKAPGMIGKEWAAGPIFCLCRRKPEVAKAAEKVQELIAPTVAALGVALWGVEYLARGRRSVLRIYIDRDEGGVDVDDCERVSRQVSALLDVEDPIPGEYTLEVSSPGMDRPLFEADQYARYIGQDVKLVLKMPVNGRRKLKGTIDGIDDGVLAVTSDGEPVSVPLHQIERARLVY